MENCNALKLYTEGKAKFYASECSNLSSKTAVFYNPAMKLNRDIAIWIVKKLNPKSICLGMEASGVRAIRLALEANASNIIANDISRAAFETMQRNIELNNAGSAIKAGNKDVKELFSQGALYDYIDIDPFGTPVYYAEPAIKALNANGVLAVTATDTSCLCGRFVNACVKKYSSRPLNNGFNKETGIRILIWKIQEIGLRQGKALMPIFAHSSSHYMRAYLKQVNIPEERINGQQGYILYCHKCLNRYVSNNTKGVCCGVKMAYAGPLWLGRLWGKELLDEFALIPYVREESSINVPWHFDVHKAAKAYGKAAVSNDSLITSLHEHRFKASRTHFKPEGIRTDADIKDIMQFF